jgi:hypothetical protein
MGSMTTPGQLVPLGKCHESPFKAFLLDFNSAPDEFDGYLCRRNASIKKAAAFLDAWGRGKRLVER